MHAVQNHTLTIIFVRRGMPKRPAQQSILSG